VLVRFPESVTYLDRQGKLRSVDWIAADLGRLQRYGAAFNEDRDMITAQHEAIKRNPEAAMMPLGIDSAHCTRCMGLHACGFIDFESFAIAINTAGRAIDQCLGLTAQTQHPDQSRGARVVRPIAPLLGRWWRQMQDAGRQARQALQTRRGIKVAQQGRDACGTQFNFALRARGQGQHAQATGQLVRRTLANIAATHDQNALSAKTGRQGA
jgi:hypothetical protein